MRALIVTTVCMLCVVLSSAPAADTILVTGTVASASSQHLIAPLTTNFNAQISFLADEGEAVAEGDVVARFDGAEVSTQLKTAEEALIKLEATGIKDIANLELKLLEAWFELESSQISQQLAQMEASVPIEHLARLEYDENQLQLERTDFALSEAREKLTDAEKSLQEKRNESAVALARSRDKIRRRQRMLSRLTIVAEQAGFMIYGHHPWMRNKFQAGDNVQTSWEVGRVSDGSELRIDAWVNAIDIPRIAIDSEVSLYFDALPGQRVGARLVEIATAGEPKLEWGDGLYHHALLEFEDHDSALRPGMSVLVEITAREAQ